MNLKFILISLFSISSFSQIPANQMVEIMGRGINLGNVLNAPIEGNWAAAVEESYFDDISLIGFKTVRIPIRFDNHTTSLSSVIYTDNSGNYIGNIDNYTVDETFLNRIEQVIDWSISKGLVTIIDVHGDKWFWESYDETSPNYKTGNDLLAAEDRFKEIWKAISIRFQSKSDLLLFEIMNEPFFSMSASQVNTTNSEILSIIRQTNSNRNIIITGGGNNSFNAPLQISDAIINSDSHLIATFHYYKPFNFTSSSQEQYTDNNWGTQADKNAITNDFETVRNWSLQKNIPVFLGEFGADNENGYNYFYGTTGEFGGPDAISRRDFHGFVANLAIEKGFSFAVWDAGDKSNKTIYKVTNKDWVIDVRNAVLNAQCDASGIIENANIECNYDYAWQLLTTNNTFASFNNATNANSYSNKTIQVNVQTASTNYNSIIIKNQSSTNFEVGENYVFKCLAKGNNNQNFKIRIKAIIDGQVVYQTSPALSLTSTFQEFQFYYTVLSNSTLLEFQVLLGNNTGNYFFDNFSMNNSTLAISENLLFNEEIIFYPNPVKIHLNFKSNKIIEVKSVYSLDGKKISKFNYNNNCIDFSEVENCTYFIDILEDKNKIIFIKIIKK